MWELDYKESWGPKNWCFWTVVLEKTLERPSDSKEIQSVNPKGDQSWVFIGRTDVEAETQTLWPHHAELTHLKRPWCWERLRAGEEVDDRGWDGWIASPTQGTWVWVDSGNRWWTGRPGMLRFMGSQRVGHDWATELTELHSLLRPKVIAISPWIILLSKHLMGISIWLVHLAEVLGPSQRPVNTMASLPPIKRCMAYILSPLLPLSLLLGLVVPNWQGFLSTSPVELSL